MARDIRAVMRSWLAWLVALATAVVAYESIGAEWLRWLLLAGGVALYGVFLAVQVRFFLGAVVPLYRGTVGSTADRGIVFRRAIASYLMVVVEFALLYTIISRFDPLAFNVGELDLPAAIYFSVTTIATVGFGDIAPVSPFVRLLVVGEILIGLAYVAFVFAMLAGLRSGPSTTPGPDS